MIKCTCELSEAHMITNHLEKAYVFLDIMKQEKTENKFIHIKNENRRVLFSNIKHLLEIAKKIEYQDNGFFGRLSLCIKDDDGNKIYNILFPQNVLTEYC